MPSFEQIKSDEIRCPNCECNILCPCGRFKVMPPDRMEWGPTGKDGDLITYTLRCTNCDLIFVVRADGKLISKSKTFDERLREEFEKRGIRATRNGSRI